jgi:hypothetical protein
VQGVYFCLMTVSAAFQKKRPFTEHKKTLRMHLSPKLDICARSVIKETVQCAFLLPEAK